MARPSLPQIAQSPHELTLTHAVWGLRPQTRAPRDTGRRMVAETAQLLSHGATTPPSHSHLDASVCVAEPEMPAQDEK